MLTQKLSVIGLIQHTKLKQTNASAHLVQYRFKLREGFTDLEPVLN